MSNNKPSNKPEFIRESLESNIEKLSIESNISRLNPSQSQTTPTPNGNNKPQSTSNNETTKK